MTWTYSGDPSSSVTDEVRFLIGDTVSADQQVQDQEIAYAVAQTGTPAGAAAMLARAIAAKYSRLVDVSVDDVRASYSQRHKHYIELADSLESSAGGGAAALPWDGSNDAAWRETQRLDTAQVRPQFKVGQNDLPGTGGQAAINPELVP